MPDGVVKVRSSECEIPTLPDKTFYLALCSNGVACDAEERFDQNSLLQSRAATHHTDRIHAAHMPFDSGCSSFMSPKFGEASDTKDAAPWTSPGSMLLPITLPAGMPLDAAVDMIGSCRP